MCFKVQIDKIDLRDRAFLRGIKKLWNEAHKNWSNLLLSLETENAVD